jgi:large subunit ribosomal protein L21
MYAVIELGGRQWKVEPGSRFDVNRVTGDIGATHTVERVLIAYDGQAMQVGRPYLDGAQVVCEVIAHHLGPKVISYHYRRRENWRKTVGHRQPMSRLEVRELKLPDGSSIKAPEKSARAASAAPRPKPGTPADAGSAGSGAERREPSARAKAAHSAAKAAAPKSAAKRAAAKPAAKKKRTS